MPIDANLPSMIFMKVGLHAGEEFEQILERKRLEYKRAGKIFWGYGGGTMHPIQRVQPFARMKLEHGETIRLVMQEIVSRHPPTTVVAKEYSPDGVHWSPIPAGVEVKGSRYALILDEIQVGDLTVDLSQYRVGTGPSEGRNAVTYIKGRVDKGCLERGESADVPQTPVAVHHTATLQAPFAVLLR
jgi:hypothetical protein